MELADQEDDGACTVLAPAGTDAAATAHKNLRSDEFWREIPAYRNVDGETFHSHLFQTRHSITNIDQLEAVLGESGESAFLDDVREGLRQAPMSIRISPYILSLVDWSDPYADPLRTQFLPLASRQLPNHPELEMDSLREQADATVPGLTHRYPDRVLFLTLDTCPVYCRFCTRSYAVGLDTEEVEKVHIGANRARWDVAFEYIESTPEIEDVVISGGDVYNLKADHIRLIGDRLLDIDHIRRFRYATKGPAVMPGKLLSDVDWVDALTAVVERGRRLHKDVVLHTHFNHPNEITEVTRLGLNVLTERGVVIRNQGVLQRGVNDDTETMRLLTKRLSFVNVQPYYIFLHDLVSGVEDLRTTLASGLEIEKNLRGFTAGFNTPTFIVDTLGGGGKRDAHSHEYYDPGTGIAAYRSPVVRPGEIFLYFDPIDCLSADSRARWEDPRERQRMVAEARKMAR